MPDDFQKSLCIQLTYIVRLRLHFCFHVGLCMFVLLSLCVSACVYCLYMRNSMYVVCVCVCVLVQMCVCMVVQTS